MSDFYGNVTDADAYQTAHGGNAKWTAATTPEKTAALLTASEWIDANYGALFPGYPTGKISQLRAWPRTNAADIYGDSIAADAVPVPVQQATYEVALRQIVSPGSLFRDWTAGKDIKQASVDGAVSVTYAGSASFADAQLTVAKVGSILAPVLSAAGDVSASSGRVSRI